MSKYGVISGPYFPVFLNTRSVSYNVYDRDLRHERVKCANTSLSELVRNDLRNLLQSVALSASKGYNNLSVHCIKSVRIRSYSGLYFRAFGLNTDQNNSEYGHFLCSDKKVIAPDQTCSQKFFRAGEAF